MLPPDMLIQLFECMKDVPTFQTFMTQQLDKGRLNGIILEADPILPIHLERFLLHLLEFHLLMGVNHFGHVLSANGTFILIAENPQARRAFGAHRMITKTHGEDGEAIQTHWTLIFGI